MFGLQLEVLLALALVVITVLAAGYGIFYSMFESAKRTDTRLRSLNGKGGPKGKVAKVASKDALLKKRADALKSVESQRAAGKKADNPPLPLKLEQAGMSISIQQFYILSILCGLVLGGLLYFVAKMPIWMAGAGAFAGSFGLPRWYVTRQRNKRFRAFILAFPNAIDIITRGVKAGLPLGDCLKIVANDTDEPVRGEFQQMVEAQQVGLTVPEACERLYQSLPTSETSFFSIVIAIQSQSGGNLSEALGGLSKVLRERRKMSDKIKAVSAEAKTSAIIIGSLPFFVAGLVAFSTPSYMVPLYTTDGGQITLIVCGVLMVIGIVTMKKMINFKF